MNDVVALQQKVSTLQEQLILEKEKREQSDAQVDSLKEQIRLFLAHRYAPSSEKLSPEQASLFNEAECLTESAEAEVEQPETVTVNAHQRTRKPRVSIPDAYPREDIIHDLPEAEKTCPHDGSRLKQIGSDDHEQLDIIPAQIKVLRHRRLKYACPCCDNHIVTAKKPKQAIEKSIASAGLLAFVATQKYCDALPLYRQSTMFKRIGIELNPSNLANWMVKTGDVVQPLIDRLTQHLQQQPLLHLDETTLQVLDEPGKTAQSKSYVWLMADFGEYPAMVFHYSPSRSQETPKSMLTSGVKTIMVDGYEGYQGACVDYGINRLGCWAHARRKFIDAQKAQPKGKVGKADQAIAFIQKLYRVESQSKNNPPDKRYELRQKDSVAVIQKIRQWLDKSLLTVLPSSKMGEALRYLNNQWDRLVLYLEDGTYPIDNNAAERAIRPFTIGRKNWLFAKSQAGATASANIYSLVETAKSNDLNPYEYLKVILTALPNMKQDSDLDELLPWNVTIS